MLIVKCTTLLVCLCILNTTCSAGGIESWREIRGNFRNSEAIQEVLDAKRTVANASWWGFDENDSTDAIQGAINSGASKVIIPYMGKEWIVRPINLVSNQEIFFEPGVVVVAKKGEFRGEFDCLFSASKCSNVILLGYGATLRMRKSDYKSSAYTKSEHRHTLQLRACSDVKVLGLRFEKSGGDGIFITRDNYSVPCTNVLIKDCVCDNNYRQGMSVISVVNLRIDNCILKNTQGTPIQAGIDLEPSNQRAMLVDIAISNCAAINNAGTGFNVNITSLDSTSREVSVLFVNCYAKDCGKANFGVFAAKETNRPRGLIEFRNCVSEHATYNGAYVWWEKNGSPIRLLFSDCKFRNTSKILSEEPIFLKLRRKEETSRAEGIEFANCYVYDEQDHPFLKLFSFGGKTGIYGIRGDINVYNPYGAKVNAPAASELALNIKSFKTRK